MTQKEECDLRDENDALRARVETLTAVLRNIAENDPSVLARRHARAALAPTPAPAVATYVADCGGGDAFGPVAAPAVAEPSAEGHYYPGCADPKDFFTSDCAYGCGCWMGSSRSGGPEGVNPFGKCPARGAR